MSRCAQSMPSATNSPRNAAAARAPPHASPVMFARSATFECDFSLSSSSTGIGSGHIGSPATPAASRTRSRVASLFAKAPATLVPRATTHAPVSVATSTIRSGLSSEARTSASPSTSRPSASVFSTSTVLPPYMVSTSDGRMAAPDGMFSAIAAYAVTWTGSPSRAIAMVAPTTAAAPPMSAFIEIIPVGGFSDDRGLLQRGPGAGVVRQLGEHGQRRRLAVAALVRLVRRVGVPPEQRALGHRPHAGRVRGRQRQAHRLRGLGRADRGAGGAAQVLGLQLAVRRLTEPDRDHGGRTRTRPGGLGHLTRLARGAQALEHAGQAAVVRLVERLGAGRQRDSAFAFHDTDDDHVGLRAGGVDPAQVDGAHGGSSPAGGRPGQRWPGRWLPASGTVMLRECYAELP